MKGRDRRERFFDTAESEDVRKNPQDPHSSSIYRSIFECWARAILLKDARDE
jgi:hypothetical protein